MLPLAQRYTVVAADMPGCGDSDKPDSGYDTELRIDSERLLPEKLVVVGTRYATRAEITATMELVRLDEVQPIVGARFPLEHLEDVLRRAQCDVFGRIMIDIADQ